MRDSHYILILLTITLFVFLFGLGSTALTDPDETFYAQTAKEMTQNGEWITPLIFGEPQFEKPIFYYWLVMASYRVFGINEFAARLPSAIFGMIGIIGVYFLGRLLFSRTCGFFAGLTLATCVQYVVLARACVTDMVLGVFIMLCLLFFMLAWQSGKRYQYILSAVMAALAVLTKGPVGLFIPGLTILIYVIFSRQWKKIKEVPVFWCIALFLCVALPWYIAVTKVHGASFTDYFFGFQNVTRFLEPEHRIGSSSFFYIPVVLAGFLPWTVFLPLAVWDMWKRKSDSEVTAHRLFLGAWFFVIFIFFSLSRTKLVTYILPLYPVMALVAGRFLERFTQGGLEGEKTKAYLKASYIVLAACGIAALIASIVIAYDEYGTIDMMQRAGVCAFIFMLGTLFALVSYLKGKVKFSLYSLVGTLMILVVPASLYLLPGVEAYETNKDLSIKLKEIALPTEAVGGECDHRRGIAFYSGRTDIEDIHPYHDFKMFLARKDRVWAIAQKKHYKQFREEKPDFFVEEVSWSGDYVLITNKPLD